jgi:competence protein ComEC
MGKRKKTRKNRNSTALIIAAIATAVALLSVSGKFNKPINNVKTAISNYSSSAVEKANSAANKSSSAASPSSPAPAGGNLTVSFIYVGQGDSILISHEGHGMLIDAGTEESSGTVVNFIKSQKITSLDYCIGTHPHEDHIGGMDSVINTYPVNAIIMPNVTNNTKSFSDVLAAIQRKKLSITRPQAGKSYNFEGAEFTVYAPNSKKYDELNDYSVVTKLVYGSTSFLFTGDAQTDSENEMLKKGYNLKADVLKVAHHGSNTSTSKKFLKAVNPKYAVISAGKGNDYKLPSDKIVKRLNNAGIKVYRTDRDGTITATTDGKTISFKMQTAA